MQNRNHDNPKQANTMKPGIDWSFNPPMDTKKILNAALIREEDYDPSKHGEITFTVNSVEEFFELFPDHLEPNMAILKANTKP